MLIIVAKFVDTLFSTIKEENLFEYDLIHLNFLIIVQFLDYMLNAMVSMFQQNE